MQTIDQDDDYTPTWREALEWDIGSERHRLINAKWKALTTGQTAEEIEEAMDAAMNPPELSEEEMQAAQEAWNDAERAEDEQLEPLLREFEREWRNRVKQHPSDPRHCECGECHLLRQDLLTNGPLKPWLVWLQNAGLWENE